ncbi:MAG: Trm112 family protein [Terriglobales bacterium]
MHWTEILARLACPACKSPLTASPARDSLKCASCKRVYPVQDDIPILLVDRATIDG